MQPQPDIDTLVEAVRDPVKFARVVLRHDSWAVADQIKRAVQEHDQVTVKSCNSSSKTHTAAELALWWILQGDDYICITTAAGWFQVERTMWKEIKSAIRGSLWPFPSPMSTELKFSEENFAVGLSTDEEIRFQGHHGNIMFIADEAPGIARGIFNAIEGNRAGGNVKLLMLGNPTIASGYYFDSFKDPNFVKFSIDAYDTPNLVDVPGDTADEREQWMLSLPPSWSELSKEQQEFMGFDPVPYLVKRRWVYEKAHAWGVDSPVYQSRVRGRFPNEDAYSLFPMAHIEAAKNRQIPRGIPLEAGIDVAGPGDAETACYVRAGDAVIDSTISNLSDPRDHLAKFLMKYKALGLVVKVDVTGIGYHVATYLKKDLGFNVRFINAHNLPTPGRMPGEDLDNRARFFNIKAQYAWSMRLRFQTGRVAGLRDEVLCSQLASMRWGEPNGKIAVESKVQARGRGQKSPDRAEALVLTFAEDASGSFVIY